jgi:DNA adenine methylase
MNSERSLEWLTTTRAAQLAGCTVQHLRLLIRQGKIKGERFGRDWMADRESVENYVSRKYERPEEPPSEVEEQRALFEDPELQPVVNVASVPQRSPFRYPGGKTWLVPTVRLWLGSLPNKPEILIEPFAGGGGIGLMAAFEGYVEKSLLIELDPDVASVWRAMLGPSSRRLADRIREFVCIDSEVRKALGEKPKSDLARAFQTLLRNRVSRGGILAPGAGLVKNGEANKGIASRWYPETLAKRIEDIYVQRSRIDFREADGLEVICEHSANRGAAFFVDPPYPIAGRRLYSHHSLDHRELFGRLASLAGPFLATYDMNPEIQALAEEFGFKWGLVPMKSTHHTRKFELLISRDLSWLSADAARGLPSSDQVPGVSPQCGAQTQEEKQACPL